MLWPIRRILEKGRGNNPIVCARLCKSLKVFFSNFLMIYVCVYGFVTDGLFSRDSDPQNFIQRGSGSCGSRSTWKCSAIHIKWQSRKFIENAFDHRFLNLGKYIINTFQQNKETFYIFTNPKPWFSHHFSLFSSISLLFSHTYGILCISLNILQNNFLISLYKNLLHFIFYCF